MYKSSFTGDKYSYLLINYRSELMRKVNNGILPLHDFDPAHKAQAEQCRFAILPLSLFLVTSDLLLVPNLTTTTKKSLKGSCFRYKTVVTQAFENWVGADSGSFYPQGF